MDYIPEDPVIDPLKVVTVHYTNYRGESGLREIVPLNIWYGQTVYHPEPQWLLKALDVKRKEERDFAMKDFKLWKP
jgi:predicted DNA-binding transcriptional regulator YafY